jgi:hypothetical protein
VAWATGTTLDVTNLGAGVVTFAGGSGVTVTNTAQTLAQYASASLIRTGLNAWTVLPKSGSAGSASGLTLITAQTIGTAVSSVAVTAAFSTTYDAYKIVITGGSASATDYLTLKLGAITSGVDESLIYKPYASGVTGASNTNQAYFTYAGNTYASVGIFLNADVVNPFLTKYTTVASTTGGQYSTASGFYSGIHKANTSFTDFTLAPFSGTLTGGTIFVYGYGK